MEIVLENPVAQLSTRTSPASTATTATPQLGLPVHPPHHFPHRMVYDVGLRRSSPLLPVEDYYGRNRHELTYGDLDGASAPVTVRRIDKSGLLEITETDPVMCSRPCVLMGAEDVAIRNVSLRVDRSGLLEAVPEAADQPEEHCNNGGATTKMLDKATVIPRSETLKADDNVNSRVFEGDCLLKRPSSLEGQACPDEINKRGHSTDMKVLTGNPRIQIDVSKATERLPHLPFSPGPSLRHLQNNSSRLSPLISRCTNADSARLQNQKSLKFGEKCIPVNSAPRKFVNPSPSPTMQERSQMGCSKDDLGSELIDSGDLVIDTTKIHCKSLYAKGSTEQDDPPGEERAEAEGCEHTTIESLEEDKVSFKGSNKLLDNDNVQTLRVIILSEQL